MSLSPSLLQSQSLEPYAHLARPGHTPLDQQRYPVPGLEIDIHVTLQPDQTEIAFQGGVQRLGAQGEAQRIHAPLDPPFARVG